MKDSISLSFGSSFNCYDENIKQTYTDSCAIKAQQIILNSKGIDVSESTLRDEAIDNGWYTPGYGTPVEETGNLLELHGVDVKRVHHASIRDISEEILQGHQVIVGVDSGELWNPGFEETLKDLTIGGKPDHALIVSGFVIDPLTGEENILLTDPGTGDICTEYPEDDFEDAWNDSDNFMVIS